MADCIYEYRIAASKRAENGAILYFNPEEPGQAQGFDDMGVIVATFENGAIADNNWRNLPIWMVPVSGDCPQKFAANFEEAEKWKEDQQFQVANAGAIDGLPGGWFNFPDWLLYAMLAAGVLSGHNAAKKGINITNGIGIAVGSYAAVRLLKTKRP